MVDEMNKPREYMIEWNQPKSHDPIDVLKKLPSPISPDVLEIYNYSVEDYGFYFIDRGIDDAVAGHAMKLFVDEALECADEVRIRKL
jgi:hypothetical protein